ncbi:glycosyltransferase [Eubacterium limosum]|uniref:glycosyltransferase n=1 Tax=Eubacterium limosum TaxID=1736 RepID=UPI001062BB51|nr:glycosyltransferase [Eubacterium limosum]
MKIVCVGYLHGSGGAERQIIMLANALAERGNDVSLIVLCELNNKYMISERVTLYDLTTCESKKGNRFLNRFKALKKAYLSIAPDVTIHYWLQSAYFTAVIKKDIRGKIIYSERGDPGDKEYKGALGFVKYIAFKKIDGFVFQSEGARDFFKSDVKKRSVIIHNPISVPENKYLSASLTREKRIVTVGRLHPQKNQRLLIEAFERLSKKIPGYILEIYGEGPLKEEMAKQIKMKRLENKVFLMGAHENIFERIYTASLFVLTSDYEGMPNALMEGMAIGLPCISTDCRPGGARTLIEDNVTGWITPIGDIDALYEKMKYVLTHIHEAETVAKNGMKIRESHTSKMVFNKWAAFVKTI